MSVFTDVLAAGDMEPVVFVIARFQDELVEVGVLLEEGDPSVGGFHIGVDTVAFFTGAREKGQADVGGFA